MLHQLFPETSVVGDKYPDYVFSLDNLANAEGLSSLVIYRDCRDVTSSTLQKARTEWRKMPLFVRKLNTAEKIARRWVLAIELMERNRDNLLVVSYENLVCESEKSLGRISDWLGVDPAGFEIQRISSRSVGNYRHGLTAEELATVMEIAGPTMSSLGYN